MAKNGLDECRQVVKDYKSLTSLAVNGAMIAPLGNIVLKVGPPWPMAAPGISIFTSLAELITLMCVFQFSSSISKKHLTKRFVAAILVLCFSFLVYTVLFASLTFSIPGTSERGVKGWLVRADVRPLITESFTADDALVGSQYDATQIWENWSITAAGAALLTSWLTLFCALSATLGMFVLSQRRRTAK
jgi:hypothetical protein